MARCVNIHSENGGKACPIERESWATYDMRLIAELTGKLSVAEQQVEELRSELAARCGGGRSLVSRLLPWLTSSRRD